MDYNKKAEDYDDQTHREFVEDMENAGIEWRHYRGRFFYEGPAAVTDRNGFPSLQEIMSATTVKVLRDGMGLDYIVYPA